MDIFPDAKHLIDSHSDPPYIAINFDSLLAQYSSMIFRPFNLLLLTSR